MKLKTSCEVVGRVDTKGHFVFEGSVPIGPGPAKAKIVALSTARKEKAVAKKKPGKANRIDAIKCAPVQEEEKSVSKDLVEWGSKPYTKKEMAELLKQLKRIRSIKRDPKRHAAPSNKIDDAVYGHKVLKKVR
jgi:hypothetical protein